MSSEIAVKKEVQVGAFLSLKAQGLIEPSDIESYDQVSYNALRSQGLIMMFSLLWTRLYEMGNFKIPVKSRYLYYGLGIGIPSFLHAFYIAKKTGDCLNVLDVKYSPKYYDNYIKKVTQV